MTGDRRVNWPELQIVVNLTAAFHDEHGRDPTSEEMDAIVRSSRHINALNGRSAGDGHPRGVGEAGPATRLPFFSEETAMTDDPATEIARLRAERDVAFEALKKGVAADAKVARAIAGIYGGLQRARVLRRQSKKLEAWRMVDEMTECLKLLAEVTPAISIQTVEDVLKGMKDG